MRWLLIKLNKIDLSKKHKMKNDKKKTFIQHSAGK